MPFTESGSHLTSRMLNLPGHGDDLMKRALSGDLAVNRKRTGKSPFFGSLQREISISVAMSSLT